ncbi:unnamed protein product, partial [Polarella glacialis]
PTSPAGKAAGKGPPPALGKGKGPTYKERKEQELRELEDKLSAAEGFCGQDLTVEEAKVINERGTEQAGSGEYEKFAPQRGYFACRKCGSAIYSHQAKFDSGCGWPAFDKCFEGSIENKPEADGTDRVEIVCAKCGGHLGHIFQEEHPAARTDQRHCANSRPELSRLSGIVVGVLGVFVVFVVVVVRCCC